MRGIGAWLYKILDMNFRESLFHALRAHFKTHVRVSEADERGAELKETNVGHRPLHAHTTSVVPGFEMRS